MDGCWCVGECVCVRERKRERVWVCGCGCFSLFLTGTSLPPTTILSTRGSHAHDEGERDKVPYMYILWSLSRQAPGPAQGLMGKTGGAGRGGSGQRPSLVSRASDGENCFISTSLHLFSTCSDLDAPTDVACRRCYRHRRRRRHWSPLNGSTWIELSHATHS